MRVLIKEDNMPWYKAWGWKVMEYKGSESFLSYMIFNGFYTHIIFLGRYPSNWTAHSMLDCHTVHSFFDDVDKDYRLTTIEGAFRAVEEMETSSDYLPVYAELKPVSKILYGLEDWLNKRN